MNKEELRKEYRNIRKNVRNKAEKDKSILELIQKEVSLSGDILLYYSTPEEVDTLSIIKYFLKNHVSVALPKIEKNNIVFYKIERIEDVKIGKFHIYEPISNDEITDFEDSICIVPGICFSKDGYRIGYGGGYYDRFLERYPGKSIGLCYQECLIDKIEVETFDQKVDKIITEKKVYHESNK